MTKIETEHLDVNRSKQDIYLFLSDFNNFESLLPQDKVEKWTSTDKTCSFRIKGMADIGMEIADQKEFDEINIVSKGKVPFNFKLDVYLKGLEEDKCTAYLLFSGDINPFMKMMIEKPLTNFFNMLVKKLAEIHA